MKHNVPLKQNVSKNMVDNDLICDENDCGAHVRMPRGGVCEEGDVVESCPNNNLDDYNPEKLLAHIIADDH